MTKPTAKAVQQLKRVDEVQEALADVKIPVEAKPHKPTILARIFWLAGIVIVVASLFAANRVWGRETAAFEWINKGLLAAMIVALVIALEQGLEAWSLGRLDNSAARFNAKRVLRLLMALLVAGVLIKILFANWYTVAASLGIASLILGFALQTPITSFIGWIYILVRKPYRVGDRVRIGEATGDVIDVSYLDTTLWEFGGEFLSTDHPSGRVIKFPNSNVLETPVYNYSWPLFPYIWNEVRINVAYESDLEFVSQVMRDVANEQVGEDMAKRVATYRQLLAETPVDELTVREHPTVAFRPSDNTWMVVILRYLTVPKEAGRVKTIIVQKVLERLNQSPERVLFPKSNLR